jgi:ABC-2 type transport system ATP-binding protein
VEQICSRIVIMDRGKKIAEGSKDELKREIKNTETIYVEMDQPSEDVIKNMRGLSHVSDASWVDGRLIVGCAGGKHNLVEVMEVIRESDLDFGRVYSELPTLNDVFLTITGKELRDKDERQEEPTAKKKKKA